MATTPVRTVQVLQDNIQYQDELETIPEEEEDPQMEEKQDVVDQDTVVFTPDESKEEPFNMAIDNTSDDPTIVMGKPVTTAFISDDVRVSTEKVGCSQVTSQLQEFLNHFPPESIEKAFEQIYQILQVLDAYLIDNPQQHQYCMSPDSEYISLIMYATKLEIDLYNSQAIWAVLSILLDTKSNELQYVKTLQQIVDDYYNKHPTEVMSRLEHQTTDIMNIMYDSVIILIEFQMILIEFQVRLITIMKRQTLTMNKCPTTMTMNKCPTTMIMIMTLPQVK